MGQKSSPFLCQRSNWHQQQQPAASGTVMLRPPSSSQARAGVSGWTGRNRGLPGQQGGEAQRWPGLWRAAHPLRPQQVDRGEQQPPREQRHPSERHDHYWRRPDHRLGGGTYTPACRQEWYRLICWASGRQEPPWGSDGKGTCVANTVCRMQQLGFGSPGPGIVGTSAPVSASALPSLGRGGGQMAGPGVSMPATLPRDTNNVPSRPRSPKISSGSGSAAAPAAASAAAAAGAPVDAPNHECLRVFQVDSDHFETGARVLVENNLETETTPGVCQRAHVVGHWEYYPFDPIRFV